MKFWRTNRGVGPVCSCASQAKTRSCAWWSIALCHRKGALYLIWIHSYVSCNRYSIVCVIEYSIHSLKKCNVFNRAKKNSPGSVDLYAKCIKEGPVEWTKPERALEAAKNVWTKSKLRLVSTSVVIIC